MFATESTQPHGMKNEILDMEFSAEVDFRKRRRNRTTQSCLNCRPSTSSSFRDPNFLVLMRLQATLQNERYAVFFPQI